MYVPDFSITNRILKTIAEIERNIGVIQNVKLLPFSLKILKKESLEKKIYSLALMEDMSFSILDIKRHIDSVSPHLNDSLLNTIDTISNLEDLAKIKTNWSRRIKLTNEKIAKSKNVFRIRKIPNKTNPDEILAKLTPIIEWLGSDDAKNTHPIIASGILLASLENIQPFEELSKITNQTLAEIYLLLNNYQVLYNTPFQEGFVVKTYKYNELLNYLKESEDFTEWLEFYTDTISTYLNILREKYQLLEREAKEKSIPNLEKLTPRQQKLYQYLLDYKFIQNSDFIKILPDVSEDSILRDLRSLLDLGLITKNGKTKSSKYELKH
jgi:Fic family protein